MDSKFEEINDAYVKYQIEVNSSFSDCERFIYKMVDGLAVYLGCDRKDLVFGPTLRKFDESKSKVMDLMEATEMEGDGYWHFGLGIKLYGHSKGLFDRTQFAQFAVKKVDDEFIVNFEYDREFNITIMNLMFYTNSTSIKLKIISRNYFLTARILGIIVNITSIRVII